MRLHRLAATFVLVATSSFGGPLRAAPISVVARETIAQIAPASPTPNPTSTLRGTVVDATTSAPLGGVSISARGSGGVTTTSSAADGTFTLTLPAGLYDIDANKGGFQAGQVASFAIVAGVASTVRLALTEANSNSLRTIGRVSIARRNSLNTSTSATAAVDGATILDRQLPNLNDTVTELPGVTLLRTTGATANSFFTVRGADVETKVNIDGHPVSVGTFGNYNTNYAISTIFDGVEVLKGAGLNGPTAGESIFGTVNLRTRDFSAKNYFDVQAGADSFQGSTYSFFGNVNLLGGKLSVLGGRAFSGYRGPYDGYLANRIGSNTGIVNGTGQIPNFTGLVQWQGDLSNRYGLDGELLKARYRFSNATSLTAEYLGLQGQYYPQGGSYASFEGNATIAPCYNAGKPSVASACNAGSLYNAPYSASLIGQTVPTYFWFPNSYIQNNEPQFSAELRTTFKNDTILLRPYAALVNRFISGDRENRYPGNAGGWYQVVDAANCQATFAGPSKATGATTGAKGPCFSSAFAGPAGPAYIGASDSKGVVYSTTPNAPTCTPTAPCYTTPTGVSNNGLIGFGTPFSQPEIDRLRGVTFQYLHPVHDNLYGFSYDYDSDDTSSNSADTTVTYPGCTPVIASGAANNLAPGTLGAQPNCPSSLFANLPVTSFAIPSTVIRKSDLAATALIQLTPALQTSLGLYFTAYRSSAQVEDPKVLAAYAAGPGSNYAPVALVNRTNTVRHFDPHVGFAYRLDRDLVLRASGGSSVTLPYASQISGVGALDLPNGSNGQAYTLTLANSALRPETTIAYDLGFDYRLADGGIFSLDAYDNTVHNIFAQVSTGIPSVAGITAPGGFFQNTTINGPIGRYYGLEAALNKNLPIGFGYTLTGSFERAYLDQLPLSLYTSAINLINGKQLDGSVNGQASIPYAKGYAEIRYAGVRNSLVTLGADYEGANNSTYGPAYTLLNGTIRFEVAPTVAFQMAVDNISNFSTGTALGRALFNQGSGTIRQGPGTAGASVRYKSLQEVGPRTYRFTLQHRF